MIGLIVTGHANFGTGITSSVNLIAGEQEAYRAVDFLPTYSTEDLTQEISKAIDDLKDCEGIIIFTDLMGGTPFMFRLNSDAIRKTSVLLQEQIFQCWWR